MQNIDKINSLKKIMCGNDEQDGNVQQDENDDK